jgi:hypothetical protein
LIFYPEDLALCNIKLVNCPRLPRIVRTNITTDIFRRAIEASVFSRLPVREFPQLFPADLPQA